MSTVMDAVNLQAVEKFIEEIESNPSLLGCTSVSFLWDFMTSFGCQLPISAHKPGQCTMCTRRPGSPEMHTCPLDPMGRAPGRPQKFQKSGGDCSSIPDLSDLQPEAPFPQPDVSLSQEELEVQKLCFEKTSPLRTEIESMEIFQKTKQKPHFNDLVSHRVGMREGIAIGSMVTFLEIAKNASNLSVDAPKSRIKDDLEVLMDLERSGFDVQILRERLTQMLLLKDEEEMLCNQQNDKRRVTQGKI